jgi:hypothetical protein
MSGFAYKDKERKIRVMAEEALRKLSILTSCV